MKYLVVSIVLFFCTLQTFSQQEYFIYLQTENGQPFYTRINTHVYNSTGSGYLILSKIPDSTTTVTIGFPKNVFPEQQFNIPVNHRDGGYLIKNFADKGWGLFNLQTASIITTLTVPEEKKKPEISGIRKTDAFSLLLANAVNDTAVLYTVARPPKRVRQEIIAEKKKDSTIQPLENAQKDSVILAKTPAAKQDSPLISKNSNQSNTDAVKLEGKVPVQVNKSNPAIKTAKDTAAVAKNRQAVVHPIATAPIKKDSSALANNGNKEDKAGLRKFSLFRGKEKAALAKNEKERKDTIILMSGGKPAAGKPITKNITAKKERSQVTKTQSLAVSNQKVDTAGSHRDAVKLDKVALPPVSPANDIKDTTKVVDKTPNVERLEAKTDTAFNPPAKRLRPLVNKVAELLTDTSYIAVFVDEAKDKFDTIRISIPFNELRAFSAMRKAITTPVPANKEIIDSAAVKTVELLPEIKKDSALNQTRHDSTPAIALPPPPSLPTLRKDTAIVEDHRTTRIDSIVSLSGARQPEHKTASDTSVVLPLRAIAGNPTKKDSVATSPVSDTNNMRRTASVAGKKDSTSVTKDTVTGVKTSPQTLYLNTDCREVATDADIDKLRIKMLMVGTDEDRITLAKKLFKQKCLQTKHVRALSEMFKTDEGKYKWLDATYAFVSDTGNFSTLGELIKDEYYLNRFKAMLRH